MKKSIMPITTGTLAGLLVLANYFLADFFYTDGNFVWVAFVSWTVFFPSKPKERLISIPSFALGFLSANLIIWLGTVSGLPSLIGGILATFLINALIMYLADIKLLSIPGIFVGIAMTFARAGVDLNTWSWQLFGIIMVYSILGLLCGYTCMHMSGKNKIAD